MLIDGPLGPSLDRAAIGKDLGTAAVNFESMLLGQIFQNAAKPLFEDSLLSGGSAGRMFNEMFVQTLADTAARGTGMGLAQLLAEPTSPAVEVQKVDDAS